LRRFEDNDSDQIYFRKYRSFPQFIMALYQANDDQHHCRLCEWYGGDIAGGLHAKCVMRGVQIIARPEFGCAFWVRAIGADDEPVKDKPNGG
jgi:hypothetical protein